MRAEKSIDIAASPKKIWPFIVEVDKFLQWETVTRFEFTGERIDEVGTTFHIVDQAADELEKTCCVVTECLQDERLAFEYTQQNVRDAMVYSIEPTEAGSRVKIVWSRNLTDRITDKILGLVFAAWGKTRMQKAIEEAIKKRLANLKGVAEARF